MFEEKTGNVNIKMKGDIGISLSDDGINYREVAKGKNFVGTSFDEYMKVLALSMIAPWVHNGNKPCGYFVAYPFCRLHLTDNAAAVAQDAYELPGNLIGWANNDEYVGADTQRGTINRTETLMPNSNQVKMVFDWPTHSANGTFQTLGFVNNQTGWMTCDRLAPYGGGGSSNTVRGVTTDGTYLFYYNEGKFYKFNPYPTGGADNEFEEIASLGATNLKGPVYHDNKLYYIHDTGSYHQLKYIDLTDNSIVEVGQLKDDDFKGISIDGGYVYLVNDNNRVYKYEMDASSYVESPITLSEGYGFWAYHSIVNSGWLMAPDGTELNLADFFAGTQTTRKNYDLLSACGQVVFLNGDEWRGKVYGFRPTAYATADPSIDGSNVEMNGLSYNSDSYPHWVGSNPRIQTLGTCLVLDTPVVKDDTQTMKITYTLTVDVG